jgi:hypothetical protein
VENVANMRVKRNAYGCLVRTPEGKSRWENPAVDGRMKFEGIKNKDERVWLKFIWLRIVTGGGCLVNIWVP